jgi:hypothetical protein
MKGVTHEYEYIEKLHETIAVKVKHIPHTQCLECKTYANRGGFF